MKTEIFNIYKMQLSTVTITNNNNINPGTILSRTFQKQNKKCTARLSNAAYFACRRAHYVQLFLNISVSPNSLAHRLCDLCLHKEPGYCHTIFFFFFFNYFNLQSTILYKQCSQCRCHYATLLT